MSKFSDYEKQYEFIRFERDKDGILLMQMHTNGGSLVWGGGPQEELSRAFDQVGADRENHVIIFTGTGDEYSGPRPPYETRHFKGVPKPSEWDNGLWRGKRMEMGMLNIEMPMIAAVNGPAKRHCELPLLCDIVLATEDTTFEDTAHYYLGNLVPGDGVNIVLNMLLGPNRARYMMFTGQKLSAQEAKTLGLVGEVLPRDKLLPRAYELARQIRQRPVMQNRYTRVINTQRLKEEFLRLQGYGMALEALADIDRAMTEQEK